MLEDLRANSWSLRPCCMVLAYRVAHFLFSVAQKNVLNNLWAAPLLVLYRIITECFSVMKSVPPQPLADALLSITVTPW